VVVPLLTNVVNAMIPILILMYHETHLDRDTTPILIYRQSGPSGMILSLVLTFRQFDPTAILTDIMPVLILCQKFLICPVDDMILIQTFHLLELVAALTTLFRQHQQANVPDGGMIPTLICLRKDLGTIQKQHTVEVITLTPILISRQLEPKASLNSSVIPTSIFCQFEPAAILLKDLSLVPSITTAN